MQQDNNSEQSNSIQIKKPRRILHCSDGIYEEYSDEENLREDPKDFSLFRKIINGIDYLGESMASILNITTPKYSYEIEQYKKMQEERQKEELEEKQNTWEINKPETALPITEVPKNT